MATESVNFTNFEDIIAPYRYIPCAIHTKCSSFMKCTVLVSSTVGLLNLAAFAQQVKSDASLALQHRFRH